MRRATGGSLHGPAKGGCASAVRHTADRQNVLETVSTEQCRFQKPPQARTWVRVHHLPARRARHLVQLHQLLLRNLRRVCTAVSEETVMETAKETVKLACTATTHQFLPLLSPYSCYPRQNRAKDKEQEDHLLRLCIK